MPVQQVFSACPLCLFEPMEMNKELMQGITQYRFRQVLLRVVFYLAENYAFIGVTVEVFNAFYDKFII